MVADALNVTTIGAARSTNKERFRLHVSDAIQLTGPRAFCARYHVLSYHSTRQRYGGKLTPAKRLLFHTGHDLHEYVVKDFLANSPWGKYVYAKWTCDKYNPDDSRTWDHPHVQDTYENVINKRCPKCDGKLNSHNEIDIELPHLLLVGHPDMIIRLGTAETGYKFYIYEFKSIDRKDISFDDIKMVMPDHRLQVTFYYNIMRRMGMNVSRKLRVMYIDRSNSKLFGGFPYKEHITEPEPQELLDPFLINLKLVKHGVATGQLPDRICPHMTGERARGCDKAVECFERRATNVKTT